MSTRTLPLALFVLTYMLGFGVWALVAVNREFIFYGVVMVLLIAAVLWMDRRVHLSAGDMRTVLLHSWIIAADQAQAKRAGRLAPGEVPQSMRPAPRD